MLTDEISKKLVAKVSLLFFTHCIAFIFMVEGGVVVVAFFLLKFQNISGIYNCLEGFSAGHMFQQTSQKTFSIYLTQYGTHSESPTIISMTVNAQQMRASVALQRFI